MGIERLQENGEPEEMAVMRQHRKRWPWVVGGLIAMAIGAFWCLIAAMGSSEYWYLPPKPVDVLAPGVIASMDSPAITYSPGWSVSANGADPAEPAQPSMEPSGVFTFTYTGNDLRLLLAPGDYWAYLYATIDGKRADALPVIAGNVNSQDVPAGYRTLLAPETVASGERPLVWVPIATGDDGTVDQARTAQIELWRGWGQRPVRGIAIDVPAEKLLSSGYAGPYHRPLWGGVLVFLIGLWCLAIGLWPARAHRNRTRTITNPGVWSSLQRYALWVGGAGMVSAIAAVALDSWLLGAAGIAVLGLAGIFRPTIWLGALLFGLPFAYGIKLPILPGRALSLIDLGVFGGAAIMIVHWGIRAWWSKAPLPDTQNRWQGPGFRFGAPKLMLLLLALLTSWALVTVVDAQYPALALREWRTVFLPALVFGVTLLVLWRVSDGMGGQDGGTGGLTTLTGWCSDRRRSDIRWTLVTAWLAGGAVVALFGLAGYVMGGDLVSHAEGVRRIQAFYDSANNLALYLDRTVAVSLALALFSRTPRERWFWGMLAAPQALAWLLTFSKGSLVLALPAMAIVLVIGGVWLLRSEGRSWRPLVWLGAALVAGALVLAPFLGAERFQRIFDLEQGTGFLRLQLWRSSWQMALDHPLLGVGPDNFLYHYRSEYMLPQAWQEPNLNHPHNLVLDFWTRVGLPGVILGIAWLASGVWGCVTWLRRGTPKALALGVLAACAAGIAHGMIDVGYALPELMIVWVFLFQIGDQRSEIRD